MITIFHHHIYFVQGGSMDHLFQSDHIFMVQAQERVHFAKCRDWKTFFFFVELNSFDGDDFFRFFVSGSEDYTVGAFVNLVQVLECFINRATACEKSKVFITCFLSFLIIIIDR